EREQTRVVGPAKHASAEHGDAAIDLQTRHLTTLIGVLPLDPTGDRIDCEGVGRGRDEQGVVADYDPGLQRAARRKRHAAHFGEVCRIRYIDRVEWREALAIESVVVAVPVGAGSRSHRSSDTEA